MGSHLINVMAKCRKLLCASSQIVILVIVASGARFYSGHPDAFHCLPPAGDPCSAGGGRIRGSLGRANVAREDGKPPRDQYQDV